MTRWLATWHDAFHQLHGQHFSTREKAEAYIRKVRKLGGEDVSDTRIEEARTYESLFKKKPGGGLFGSGL